MDRAAIILREVDSLNLKAYLPLGMCVHVRIYGVDGQIPPIPYFDINYWGVNVLEPIGPIEGQSTEGFKEERAESDCWSVPNVGAVCLKDQIRHREGMQGSQKEHLRWQIQGTE